MQLFDNVLFYLCTFKDIGIPSFFFQLILTYTLKWPSDIMQDPL